MAKVRVLNLPNTEARHHPREAFARDLDGGGSWVDGSHSTAESALEVGAVFGCVRLISGTVATLPMDLYRRINQVRRPHRPKPEWLNFNVGPWNKINIIQQAVISILLAGNAYLATFRDRDGTILFFEVLNPDMVEPKRLGTDIVYDIVNRDGTTSTLTKMDVLHIPGMMMPGAIKGMSVLKAAAMTIGISREADSFAEAFYRNDARPSMVIEAPDEMNDQQVKILKETWNDTHRGAGNSHKLAVATAGAKFKAITVNADDAQLIETKRWQVPTICMFFGVPPQWLGYSDAPQFGNTVSATNTFFTQHVLREWVERIEEAFSDAERIGSADPQRDELFVGLNMNSFTRGDRDTRIATNLAAAREGVFTINEVRAMEDFPEVEWGDRPISVQVQELTEAGEAAAGESGGSVDADALDADTAREIDLIQMIRALQQIYLSVGTVISAEEARRIISEFGFDLPGGLPAPQDLPLLGDTTGAPQ